MYAPLPSYSFWAHCALPIGRKKYLHNHNHLIWPMNFTCLRFLTNDEITVNFFIWSNVDSTIRAAHSATVYVPNLWSPLRWCRWWQLGGENIYAWPRCVQNMEMLILTLDLRLSKLHLCKYLKWPPENFMGSCNDQTILSNSLHIL